MGLKKILIPLMVLFLASQAFAAVTTTINTPTAGQTFFPATQNQRFMDINFTVVDSVATNPIHTVIIQFDSGDGNISIASDLNIDNSNCVFHVSEVWTTPGADCVIRYTFPRTGTTLSTRTYVLDVNAISSTAAGEATADDDAITTFRIDNRLVSGNVLTILNLSTLILAGILILFFLGFLGGVIDANTMVFIVVVGIGAVIGIILVSEFLLLLTP